MQAREFALYGQKSLIDKLNLSALFYDDAESFPDLSNWGVCFGLCVDYARHIINHNNSSEEKGDYTAKLKLKLEASDEKSKNFTKRIDDYQSYLQYGRIFFQLKDSNISTDNNRFIQSVTDDNTSSIIGLRFVNNIGGHIIAIHAIRDEEQKLVGYKVFDPNIGEFDCSNESAAVNAEHCNEVIKYIGKLYSQKGYNMEDCITTDLEKLVTDYELIKPKDRSQYSKAQKYLETNPHKQEVLNNNLFRQARLGSTTRIEFFLGKGAEVNAASKGFTPLYAASFVGHKEAVELLLAKGAEVDLACNGFTPLNVAVEKGHDEICKVLVENGADFTKKNSSGQNLLHYCCEKGNIELLNCFVDRIAPEQLKIPDKSGKTPEEYAKVHPEIIELLQPKLDLAQSAISTKLKSTKLAPIELDAIELAGIESIELQSNKIPPQKANTTLYQRLKKMVKPKKTSIHKEGADDVINPIGSGKMSHVGKVKQEEKDYMTQNPMFNKHR